jgi:hypothetical protein
MCRASSCSINLAQWMEGYWCVLITQAFCLVKEEARF